MGEKWEARKCGGRPSHTPDENIICAYTRIWLFSRLYTQVVNIAVSIVLFCSSHFKYLWFAGHITATWCLMTWQSCFLMRLHRSVPSCALGVYVRDAGKCPQLWRGSTVNILLHQALQCCRTLRLTFWRKESYAWSEGSGMMSWHYMTLQMWGRTTEASTYSVQAVYCMAVWNSDSTQAAMSGKSGTNFQIYIYSRSVASVTLFLLSLLYFTWTDDTGNLLPCIVTFVHTRVSIIVGLVGWWSLTELYSILTLIQYWNLF